MKVSSECFVSVAVPLQNDADIAESFLEELCGVLRQNYANFEIVLVDDGSSDGTAEVVGDLIDRFECLRLICLSRGFGQEIAIAAALDSVIGDYVVVMLPNTDPPHLIPAMVAQARQGFSMVLGVRSQREQEGMLARYGARVFYWYCNHVLGLRVPENAAVFRVMSRQAVNAVTQIKDRLRYIRLFGAYVGYKSQEHPYEPINRRGELRSRSLLESIQLAIAIIVASSAHPLRVVTWLGLAVSGLNVAYMGYVLVAYFIAEELAAGWVTRSLQTSAMFFFLFVMMAVLCEYMGRILAEIQMRPLYYVREERSSPTLIVDSERVNVVTRSGDR